ncbi:MAG: response regulator transcription factor [Magnetococcales bacterium]|nr:response regulator transcription factor [Magnetococcales bacterium]
MIQVALVEDDMAFRETVTDFLDLQEIQVHGAETGNKLMEILTQHSEIKLVILDVNLENESGFDIANALHEQFPQIGIIMLTARQTVEDHITGLQSGADIYLTKPINLMVLEAKIRALVRRVSKDNPDINVWKLSTSAWTLHTPQGQEIALTSTEMAIIERLSKKPGQSIPYDQFDGIFAAETRNDTHRLAVQINRLRKKVKSKSGETLPIKAARNIGYCFTSTIKNL